MEIQEYRKIIDKAQRDYEARLETMGIELITEAAARVAITGRAFASLEDLQLRCDR